MLKYCMAILLLLHASILHADVQTDAHAGMKRAVEFFHKTVAIHGGYVWKYSADLSLREGEGKTNSTTIWAQPPGTPAVGLAYLRAFERTKEPYLLHAARDAGKALVFGQLQSGGWNNGIEFDPKAPRKELFRRDSSPGKKLRNLSSLDDNKSQSCLQLLMRLDRALDFADKEIHDAAQYGLNALLTAQHANGAWSQVWDGVTKIDRAADLRASIPENWPRTYPGGDYWWHDTLNDGALTDTLLLMLDAAELYQSDAYRQAALRAGEFLIRAQLPDPHPAWAQQYDAKMQPAWARKFEPPAVSSRESVDAIKALLRLAEVTKDNRFIAPIPPALQWLEQAKLPNGRWARFYELATNRPLYMTHDYQLTYKDDDTPTHYGFQLDINLDDLKSRLARAQRRELTSPAKRPSAQAIQDILNSQDPRGAWLTAGGLKYQKYDGDVIDSQVFIQRLDLLSRFLAKE